MNIRTLFAVVRLMFSILFRFTPIQSTGQEKPTQTSGTATGSDEKRLQETVVIPLKENTQKSPATTADERPVKAA